MPILLVKLHHRGNCSARFIVATADLSASSGAPPDIPGYFVKSHYRPSTGFDPRVGEPNSEFRKASFSGRLQREKQKRGGTNQNSSRNVSYR